MRLFEGTDGVPLGVLPGSGMDQKGIVEQIHGLVMTGGGDPAPELFGCADEGSRSPETHRPLWEMELFREAVRAGIPVLAICLGMQLVGIARGTPLIQDIPARLPDALDHQAGFHPVVFSPGSGLNRLLGNEATVASAHHQALEAVPIGYRRAGASPDGVIEAIESPDGLVTGVQWHPERDSTGPLLIGELIRKAREAM